MVASLYRKLPADTENRLQFAVDKGLAKGQGKAEIFFRADDIGVPGEQFSQLIQLFLSAGLPLCLAVVPSWLTVIRFEKLLSLTGKDSSQWCWHQHGWLHRNHESQGKKQEFGSARPVTEQRADLAKGKERLTAIMGKTFSPFFTPPWNRCSLDTLQGLQELQFKGVSRSSGATPLPPPGLPDIQVNTDLHTRREENAEVGLSNLLKELEQGLTTGRSGIMIHHQRMNQTAFDFLALLLNLIASHPGLYPVRFQEIIRDYADNSI
ncbi:MAG: polysaccharide deacetylase family protein [Proteobacteria bacterium]|nr:polysaccharide deacetylase family protein [Pseudomonadota bacterium]MBU1417780.1 polysaccharide deacetylase family protein [Pseudomonadota bacterium]MBU1453482.1 polysaccharide deacetylase family protein [Pseudomonadota bacterium]